MFDLNKDVPGPAKAKDQGNDGQEGDSTYSSCGLNLGPVVVVGKAMEPRRKKLKIAKAR